MLVIIAGNHAADVELDTFRAAIDNEPSIQESGVRGQNIDPVPRTEN